MEQRAQTLNLTKRFISVELPKRAVIPSTLNSISKDSVATFLRPPTSHPALAKQLF